METGIGQDYGYWCPDAKVPGYQRPILTTYFAALNVSNVSVYNHVQKKYYTVD